MKKIILHSITFRIMLAAAMIAVTGLWANGKKPYTTGLDTFSKANAEIMAQGDDSARVVFFGNSITECWPLHRPEYFKAHGYICRGISGQDTYQLLGRFRQDVVDLHPAVVVMSGGTNDIAENNFTYSEESTLNNIKSMVDIARANGIKVILGSVLPASGFKWNPGLSRVPDKIISLNRRLAEYASAEGIPFLDYHTPLAAGDGRSLNPDITADGVHPDAGGYIMMEALAQPAIEKALER